MDTLAGYLNRKHMEYCQKKGRILSNQEWVMEAMNSKLPADNQLSVGTFNHWMNGGREPEGKNISRLITIFGPEIMPYLGIKLDRDLMAVITQWDSFDEDTKQKIYDIAKENDPVTATLQI